MALIKCPECTKEVSDKSEKCVHCGYPIRQSFYTNIYIPKYRSDNFVEDFMCYFIRDKVNITNENGTRVYVHGGKTDMNYKLFIKEPTKIKILLHNSYTITGMIYPGKNYTLGHTVTKKAPPKFIIIEQDSVTVGNRQI